MSRPSLARSSHEGLLFSLVHSVSYGILFSMGQPAGAMLDSLAPGAAADARVTQKRTPSALKTKHCVASASVSYTSTVRSAIPYHLLQGDRQAVTSSYDC